MPQCGGYARAFDCGIGESAVCSVCGKEVEIPTDPALTEHIPDPEPDKAATDTAADAEPDRGPFITFVLWGLAILNPLAGIMVLISALTQLRTVSLWAVTFGSLMVLSLIFVIGLFHRRLWAFWGYVAILGFLVVASLIQTEWEFFLRLLVGTFLFLLAMASEWEYLR